ncbi:MAG TPA: hypothetical protein VN428_22795 [Bryobacteraceae bacterium]|nr:hypothetical protein [Bryobacteraceae bacterium]
MKKRRPQKYRVQREGLLLEIEYEPNWMPGAELAHITCRSIYPTDVPLPIASSGFYQHTLSRSIVNAAGGPVDYIDVMMSAEAAE